MTAVERILATRQLTFDAPTRKQVQDLENIGNSTTLYFLYLDGVYAKVATRLDDIHIHEYRKNRVYAVNTVEHTSELVY
jgi:hypothetical protein